MTEREFLKGELLKSIDQNLQLDRFILNKSQGEFTRPDKSGWSRYQVIFLKGEEGWDLNLGMLIRKDIVENIFHKTSGFEPKYQKNTPTIGCSVENYLMDKTDKYRFSLKQESEINDVAKEISEIYNSVAAPFFKKYSELKSIDHAVNSDPKDTLLTGDIFKGSKGIILARLTGRSDYDDLASLYLKHYETFAKGFYLPSFKNLLEYLSQVSPIE